MVDDDGVFCHLEELPTAVQLGECVDEFFVSESGQVLELRHGDFPPVEAAFVRQLEQPVGVLLLLRDGQTVSSTGFFDVVPELVELRYPSTYAVVGQLGFSYDVLYGHIFFLQERQDFFM